MNIARLITTSFVTFALFFALACGGREEGGDLIEFTPSQDFNRVLSPEDVEREFQRMEGVRSRMAEITGIELGEVQIASLRFEIARAWLDEQVEEYLASISRDDIDEEAIQRGLQLLDGVGLTNVEAYDEEAIERFHSALDEALRQETMEEAIAHFSSEVTPIREDLPREMRDDPETMIIGFWEIREYFLASERQSVTQMKESNREIVEKMIGDLHLAVESLREQGRWDRETLLEEAGEFLNWEKLHEEYGDRSEFPDLIAAAFIDREVEHLRARLVLDHTSALNREGREHLKEIREIKEWTVGKRELGPIVWNEMQESFVLPRFYPLLELVN